jgi:hypothetical protein
MKHSSSDTLEDTLRGGVKPYRQAYTLEDTLRGEPSTESPAGAAVIMVFRRAVERAEAPASLYKGLQSERVSVL